VLFKRAFLISLYSGPGGSEFRSVTFGREARLQLKKMIWGIAEELKGIFGFWRRLPQFLSQE
jgi:hypothetical protein